MDNTIPSEIKNAIVNDRLILFVGSGLSRRFNLPTWEQMTIDLINEIGDDKYKSFIKIMQDNVMDPIGVLDIIKNERNKIHKYIEEHFQIDSTADFSTHKRLLEVSKKIITTNYDNAFELTSQDLYRTTYESTFKINNLKDKDKFLFKLHGSTEDASKCIIFKDDYDSIYEGESSAIFKLKDFFINNTILFLGFSFKDIYVNKIFNHINKLFEGNNRHFILTTEPKSFEDFTFLKAIKIESHDQIDLFLQECIDFKSTLNPEIVLSEKTIYSHDRVDCNIAFLYPEPVDVQLDLNVSAILNSFENLNANIKKGYLNLKTLSLIDEFDYVIIVTKCFKGKVYIEDDFLKSQLVTYDELERNISNDKIIRILICDDKVDFSNDSQLIHINSYKPALINKLIYKTIRNNELNYIENEIKVINIGFLPTIVGKGVLKTNSIYSNKKPLDFVSNKINNTLIGRIEEQSIIAKRILNLIESNQILNIKGSGGIGKTSLIKKIAYGLYVRGYFNDGVTFRSCENVKTFDDFEIELIQGFNLQDIENFKEYLQENDDKLDLLLILDNFETVSNLDRQELLKVVQLLDFASNYANIVITSRETLGQDFEDVYTLNTLITDDAVKLFFKYYKEIKDEKELRILRVDILENLLNNNPLAIKLVTHNSLIYSRINELKAQLEEKFFEITSDEFESIFNSDADLNIERSKSIYQSINYSYDKLGTKEKLTFEILHLFPDGIGYGAFKKWFNKNNTNNSVGDRELKQLQDKSLIENNEGFLQLQPIVRRFAEFQFAKRDGKIKKLYYTEAYSFNAFMLKLIRNVYDSKSLSAALKIQNVYKNNLSMVLDYVQYIDLSEKSHVNKKQYILNYAYDLDDYIVNPIQVNKFSKRIFLLKDFFKDVKFADTLIDVLIERNTYYLQNFNTSYEKMSNIFPVSEIANRDYTGEDYIEERYKNIISKIHSMEGHTFEFVKTLITHNIVEYNIFDSFFYLGIIDVVPDKSIDFYKFEKNLTLKELNVDELEEYIDSLYTDEHLEILQCTYILSKVIKISNQRIKKLVISNPYTKGLQALMYAFNENNYQNKEKHFLNALTYLSHIKYYYLEALFYYCQHLLSNSDERFDKFYNEGLNLCSKYYYQYLEFRFKNISEESTVYKCDYSYYPDVDIEDYLHRYNKFWKDILENN